MNDNAIAEHIVYLVEQHNKQLQLSVTTYKRELSLACMAFARNPGNTNITFPKSPESILEITNTLLLDRIQAILENRSKQ